MGIFSLFFIAVFSLLFISRGWEKKPEAVVKAVDKIMENIDTLSFAGFIYGLVAIILTPLVAPRGGGELLICLFSNVLISLMALPYALQHIENKYRDKVNASVMAELKNFVGFVTRHEKNIGLLGGVLTVMLFAILFR